MFDKNAKLLYLVTDRTWLGGESLESAVEAALRGGVNVVQLREKRADFDEYIRIALPLRELTRAYNVPLIINDKIDVALAVGADGVHLGASDIDIAAARAAAGGKLIIGASARTVDAAIAAEQKGADYLGVGAVFGTTTKKDAKNIDIETLAAIARAVTIPTVAIGGVNETNARLLKDSGANGIAVISAILSKPDKQIAAETLAKIVNEFNTHAHR